MDEVALAAAVSRLLNAPCHSLRGLGTGYSNSRTYVAQLTDRDVIVKVNADVAALARTGHNLEVLTSLGIPVPKLLAYDDSGVIVPGAIVVMERLDGADLGGVIDAMTRDQLTRLAEQIVDIQRRVATLPNAAGCGFVGIGEDALRTWKEIVCEQIDDAADPLPADSEHLIPALTYALAGADAYFDRVTSTAFLDDATTKNVMIRDGVFVGIVDLDVICYGDPLFHLGLTAAAVTANAPRPESRHYVDELIRFSGLDLAQQRIVDLYEAVFLTSFLTVENPDKPGPWRRRALEGAERALGSAQS